MHTHAPPMALTSIEAAVFAGRVSELLPLLEAAASPRQKRWLFDRLDRAIRLADPGSVPVALLVRLAAQGVHPEALEQLSAPIPPQAVHVPFVGRHDGRGFCRLMHTVFDPDVSQLERVEVGRSARKAMDEGLEQARLRLQKVVGRGYAFVPVKRGSLDDARIEGDSLGAGAYVSALARLTRRPLLEGTAVTGSISEGRVRAVGGMKAKLEALHGRSDIRRFVVPEADHSVALALAADVGVEHEILAAASLDDLERLCLEKEPTPLDDPEETVDALKVEVDHGWQHWQWPHLGERIARLAEWLPRDAYELRVRSLTMLGAVYRNGGDPDRSASVLEEATALLAHQDARWLVGDRWRSYLHRHRAMTATHLGRLHDASEAAQRSIDAAERARYRPGYSIGHGVLGLVMLAGGDAEKAVTLHERAIETLDPATPERFPRAASYLLDALGRTGNLDRARGVHAEIEERLSTLEDSSRTRTSRAWAATSMLSALVRSGEYEEACSLGRDPEVRRSIREAPLPGLHARRWVGIAEAHAGDRAAGYALLGDSPVAYDLELGPRNRVYAAVNVLREAVLRAAFDEVDVDLAGRVEAALPALGYSESVRRELSPAVRRLLESFGEGAGAKGARQDALRRLIDACDRLG